MTDIACVLTLLAIVALLYCVIRIIIYFFDKNCPAGWEDEEGFHYGKQK